MSKRRWDTIRDLFQQAAERPATERAALLDSACGDDQELRAEVESLLEARQAGNGFLEDPTFDLLFADALDGPTTSPGLQCGTVIGRYKLLEKIGEGGFGVVYMAEQREPIVRKVALKVIKLGMDTAQVIARFEAERQALALMDHPNIAKVLDAGTTDVGPGGGRPYFVMELVRGDSITEYCDANRLDTAERLRLFVDVCSAIQHAHHKGVIHRDIKPSNVLVTRHDDKAVVKVIDFGIAKATQQRLTEKTLFTEFRQLIGTPVYMSPEQAQMSGLDIDTRSDVYSLGVLLYELLTGQTPFDLAELASVGFDEIRRRIREDEPPKPSTRLSTLGQVERSKAAAARRIEPDKRGSWIQRDLDWVVMKALEKDRTRRYESASELGLDVRRFLDHEPVTAVAPTAAYRFRRFARRHRGALLTSVVILLLLVSGTVVSVWQAMVATAAREEAERSQAREAALRVQAERDRQRAIDGERRQRLGAYAADMRVVQVSLEEHNLGRARDLLARYIPEPGAEDLRGIEWRYLWAASRGDESYSIAHGCRVSGLALSADGRLLATQGHDRKIRVISTDSRKTVKEFAMDAAGPPSDRCALAFSPNGSLLAADTGDGVVVWDVDGWRVVKRLEDSYAPLCFSADGTRLATIAEDGIGVWDTSSWGRRVIATGAAIHRRGDQWLAFGPQGGRLAFSRMDYAGGQSRLEIWDVRTGERTAAAEDVDRPNAVSFSSDGNLVLAGSRSGFVLVWDPVAESARRFRAHEGSIYTLALLPGENGADAFVTAGDDQVIRVWHMSTLEPLRSLKGHEGEIWNVRASASGRLLASTSKDGTAKLWHLEDASSGIVRHDLPDGAVLRGFTADGKRLLLSGGDGRSVLELEIQGGEIEEILALDSEDTVDCTGRVLSPDQERSVLGTLDGRIVVVDARGRRSHSVGEGRLDALWISPRGRYALLFSSALQHHVLWDLEEEALVGKVPGKGVFDFAVTISPDESWLASPGAADSIETWRLPDMVPGPTLTGSTWRITDLSFSPDSRLLASSGWEGAVRIWDIEHGVETASLLKGHLAGVGRVEFSPDGRTIATASDDGTVRLWSASTGQELVRFSGVRGFWTAPLIAPTGDALIWSWRKQGTAWWTNVEVTTIPTLAEIDHELRM